MMNEKKNTYFVQVNGLYMVKVEAFTNGGAEHMILDNIPGTQSALAFDAEAMKTDYFMECFASAEVVSQSELANLFSTREHRIEEHKQACAAVALASIKVEDARQALADAEEALKEAVKVQMATENDVHTWDHICNYKA